MSEYKIIDPTPEQMQEIARKFNTTVDHIRAEWEATKAQGPEGVLAEMEQQVAEYEATTQVVVDDTVARHLVAGPGRARSIVAFYEEGWSAFTADEVDEMDKADLFLRLAVAIYMLAEAQVRIAALSDGGHRVGGEDEQK